MLRLRNRKRRQKTPSSTHTRTGAHGNLQQALPVNPPADEVVASLGMDDPRSGTAPNAASESEHAEEMTPEAASEARPLPAPAAASSEEEEQQPRAARRLKVLVLVGVSGEAELSTRK